MNQKFLIENFFMAAQLFPRNQVYTKTFHQEFFGRNFLWLRNHILEKRLEPKIFIKNFLVENLYACKIISSKTGWNLKFSLKKFLVEIF